MRPQHLALCLFCAVVSGKRTKKTKQPTPAPVREQTAASGPTQATLLYENASCEGSDQGAYLGTPASVDECAVSAAAAGCDMFMFSESYGYSWGCRCCSAKTQYHDNWSIYSVDSKNSQRTPPRPTPRPPDWPTPRPTPDRPRPTTAPTTHSCPTGYVADCEARPGRHCCPEQWIGTDCDDHYEFMKHCDLTCYDNDGGDCVATTPGPTPEPTPEPSLAPTLAPTTKEPTPVVRGSLTLSGLVSPTRSEPVLQAAIAGVAGVPMEAVRIIGIQTQRRHLRRRLEASTVVVDYEIDATDTEAVARKLAETTPAEFDVVIQDVAAAAGAGAAFADVRTEEISVASAEASGEEEEEEDDASTSKFASVKFIASVAAGASASRPRWRSGGASSIGAGRRRRSRHRVPAPRADQGAPWCPRRYARPVASAPPLAPLAPEPPLASIKERALAEAAPRGRSRSGRRVRGVLPHPALPFFAVRKFKRRRCGDTTNQDSTMRVLPRS